MLSGQEPSAFCLLPCGALDKLIRNALENANCQAPPLDGLASNLCRLLIFNFFSAVAQAAQLSRAAGRQGAAACVAPSFEHHGFELPPLPPDLSLPQPPAPLLARVAQGLSEPALRRL